MYAASIRLLAAAAVASWTMWALGCSLVVDSDECSESASCVTKYGRGWQCTEDNICQRQPLVQTQEAAPCSDSAGPIDDPDAFNIGVMLPLDRSEGANRRPLLEAIKLAQDDFNELGGVDNRPIGLIICDTEGKDDIALQSADHLVHGAGVEALIGPNFSNQAIATAVEYTVPNDVLLVTPAA
ncbi:MAG: ABC transporter substrate-binding protein, partial [Persicimonas sp.]